MILALYCLYVAKSKGSRKAYYGVFVLLGLLGFWGEDINRKCNIFINVEEI